MRKICILFVSFIALSCNNNNKTQSTPKGLENIYFKSFLEQHKQATQIYKKIIIIPGSGCTSCITGAETYYTKNYTDSSILYVFTAIGDVKILKLKFADNLINRKNVIIDEDNELVDNGFTSIYPSIAEINNNEKLVKLYRFSE